MIKADFRDRVRSKTPVAMVNEVLASSSATTSACSFQETNDLGIDVEFAKE